MPPQDISGKDGALPCGPGSQASPEAAEASSPSVSIPNAAEVKLPRLKSEVFYASNYGQLGNVYIVLPENNGGDEQFEADFAACLDFVRGVMLRRKSARFAQAIEARRAETAQTGSVEDESAVGNADAPNTDPLAHW